MLCKAWKGTFPILVPSAFFVLFLQIVTNLKSSDNSANEPEPYAQRTFRILFSTTFSRNIFRADEYLANYGPDAHRNTSVRDSS
jgi:hypothetical protein